MSESITVLGVVLAHDPEWPFQPDDPNRITKHDSFKWSGKRGSDEWLSVQHAPLEPKLRERWHVHQVIGDCDGTRRRGDGLASEHYRLEHSGYGETLDLAVEDLIAARAALMRRLTEPAR